MAKYHIFEIQVKKADYRSLVSPQMMDKMQQQRNWQRKSEQTPVTSLPL